MKYILFFLALFCSQIYAAEIQPEFSQLDCKMTTTLPRKDLVTFSDSGGNFTWRINTQNVTANDRAPLKAWNDDATNMSWCMSRWSSVAQAEIKAVQSFVDNVQISGLSVMEFHHATDQQFRDHVVSQNPLPSIKYTCTLNLPKGRVFERKMYNEWADCVTDWGNKIYRVGLNRDREVTDDMERMRQRIMKVN